MNWLVFHLLPYQPKNLRWSFCRMGSMLEVRPQLHLEVWFLAAWKIAPILLRPPICRTTRQLSRPGSWWNRFRKEGTRWTRVSTRKMYYFRTLCKFGWRIDSGITTEVELGSEPYAKSYKGQLLKSYIIGNKTKFLSFLPWCPSLTKHLVKMVNNRFQRSKENNWPKSVLHKSRQAKPFMSWTFYPSQVLWVSLTTLKNIVGAPIIKALCNLAYSLAIRHRSKDLLLTLIVSTGIHGYHLWNCQFTVLHWGLVSLLNSQCTMLKSPQQSILTRNLKVFYWELLRTSLK